MGKEKFYSGYLSLVSLLILFYLIPSFVFYYIGYFTNLAVGQYDPFTFIGCTLGLVILPIVITILWIIRYGYIIEIDEVGIRKSLFKKFYKKDFTWEKIKDIKMVRAINGTNWAIISTSEIPALPFQKLIK